ncbi:MAG: sensor histidine kinase [Candidatus Methylomirabilales bacterium]
MRFRLALCNGALFGALSLAVFLVVYIALTSSLGQRADDDLLSTVKEFEALYATNGVEALRAEFQREAESRGIKRVFFRLMSPRRELLAASDLRAWGKMNGIALRPAGLSNEGVGFRTVSVPGRRHKVRVILKRTADGHMIQFGATLQENEALMEKYRETFGTALAVMLLCGGAVGWILAGRAMSGVERVTQTAVRIGQGDLSRRVPLGNEGQEIEDLAKAFNDMLARIQMLVRELKEVTNNIAHDLRSPITRVRGIAETTLAGDHNFDAYREMAGAVIEESDRLVAMINTMLEIAQTDSGIADFSKTPVDVGKLIKDARELFRPVAEDKGIHLQVDVPVEHLTVLGDTARLQRVVANLLDNAIKYSSAGGNVLMSTKATAPGVAIEVVDVGVGITDGELPHIFERFYRGDRSRSTPGSGLGLSLARAIVRAHGGDITATSSPGKGSTFTVLLPAVSSPL